MLSMHFKKELSTLVSATLLHDMKVVPKLRSFRFHSSESLWCKKVQHTVRCNGFSWGLWWAREHPLFSRKWCCCSTHQKEKLKVHMEDYAELSCKCSTNQHILGLYREIETFSPWTEIFLVFPN